MEQPPNEVIEMMLDAMKIPMILRPQLRAKLAHQMGETGTAHFAIPVAGPGSLLPFSSVIGGDPAALSQPAASPEAKLLENIKDEMTDNQDKEMEDLREELSEDIFTLTHVDKLLEEVNDAELDQKLARLRNFIADNLGEKIDSYIAEEQRRAHERRGRAKQYEFQRWQREVLDGKTFLGFDEWKTNTPNTEASDDD